MVYSGRNLGGNTNGKVSSIKKKICFIIIIIFSNT